MHQDFGATRDFGDGAPQNFGTGCLEFWDRTRRKFGTGRGASGFWDGMNRILGHGTSEFGTGGVEILGCGASNFGTQHVGILGVGGVEILGWTPQILGWEA